ncbi:hypothetical protein [Pseudonocardia nigra]|uniref:hypothetical protein n=1 Tax=Pseudonocardia nigra TaxID=1921578 RepID=UPI001C5FB4AF|nr:hypothetical protein [Pseudonocardia nigra]
MSDLPSLTLRVEPDALPALRAAYGRAADDIGDLLNDVGRRGRLAEPADDISVGMAEHYNHEVMDGAYSTYTALRRYEQELRKVVDTLKRREDDYRRNEDAVADEWRRS